MERNKYAPIVLFVYCRQKNVQETIEYLKKNEETAFTDLIIYSDAPKDESKTNSVLEVRKFLKTISGFHSVQIIERHENMGLAKSIVDGVTHVVNKYGRVIVLEDDLNVSPYFLKYMNEALVRYEKREDVVSVHGYVYPTSMKLPEAFLIRGADCWGWATWKHKWDLFCFDAKSLYETIAREGSANEFEFDGSFPYLRMLERQITGLSNSWAVCWYASAFVKRKYTLYPGKSLVNINSIYDEGATHGGDNSVNKKFLTDISMMPVNWKKVDDLYENMDGRKAFRHFFLSLKSPVERFEYHLKKLLPKSIWGTIPYIIRILKKLKLL